MICRANTAECLEYGSPRLAEVIPIEAGFSRRSPRMNRRNIGAVIAATEGGDEDFTPTDISGGLFWLDMQDADSYTQAGTVTQFINKMSDVAWDDVNPAAYDATIINGFPGMNFDGINDHYISTEAALVTHFTGGGIAYTMAGVWQHAVADSTERVFGVGNSASANGHRSWGTTTTGAGVYVSAATSDAAGTANIASAGGSDTDLHVFIWNESATAGSLQVDNGAADPADAAHAPGTITPDRCAVGCRPGSTPGVFFAGNLGELIIWDSQLSAAQILQAYNYLSDKWGL